MKNNFSNAIIQKELRIKDCRENFSKKKKYIYIHIIYIYIYTYTYN